MTSNNNTIYLPHSKQRNTKIMYKVENILRANGIKAQAINTPNGVLIMADNGDGTFEKFPIDIDLKKVYDYIGY